MSTGAARQLEDWRHGLLLGGTVQVAGAARRSRVAYGDGLCRSQPGSCGYRSDTRRVSVHIGLPAHCEIEALRSQQRATTNMSGTSNPRFHCWTSTTRDKLRQPSPSHSRTIWNWSTGQVALCAPISVRRSTGIFPRSRSASASTRMRGVRECVRVAMCCVDGKLITCAYMRRRWARSGCAVFEQRSDIDR